MVGMGAPDEGTGLVPSQTTPNNVISPSPVSNVWKAIACISTALLMIIGVRRLSASSSSSPTTAALKEAGTCMYCQLNQDLPQLFDDKSYTISVDGDDVVVTPMTITFNYDLYNGQNLFTDGSVEKMLNLDYDYAILGITTARNVNRETNENVSLDEVYVHHFTINPFNMVGAEVLTRDEEMPFVTLPHGYALHVRNDETPFLTTNAHLLSHKDIAPVNGSLPLAHKHCNECYYAEHKGSECTPELSGTFVCCGDSEACMAGELCLCATNEETDLTQTTKYKIEVDFLISRDIDKFQRVDQWNLAAPACSVSVNGGGIFAEYAEDNFCFSSNATLTFGGGSLFHQIPQDDTNPYIYTKISLIAPHDGTIVSSVGHLHTGGINVTLRINGNIVCAAGTVYGTDSHLEGNAKNEQNHLIQIEPCTDIDANPVSFHEADIFTLESVYYGGTDDERFHGYGAAGEHKNVMSMMFMGVVFEGDAGWLTDKHTSFNAWNDFVHTVNWHEALQKDDYKI